MGDRLAGRRSHLAAGLLGLGMLAWGCGGIKQRPAYQTCNLADGRQVPVGAIFSDGCGCCVCLVDGPQCFGVGCVRHGDGGVGLGVDEIPCRSDGDCTAAGYSGMWCVFDQGCSPGQGLCTAGWYGDCPGGEGKAADYCGCDGQTLGNVDGSFALYPNRPYAHLGTCP